MALTQVQHNQAGTTSASAAVTLSSSSTPGDLLVFTVASGATAVYSTPSGFTKAVSGVSASQISLRTFYKIADGTETTIQSNLDSSRAWRAIVVQYNDSAGGPWSLDQVGTNSGASGTTFSVTANATTTRSTEVWNAVFAANSVVAMAAPTNGYAVVDGASGGGGGGSKSSYMYDQVVGVTGNAATSVTATGSTSWVGIVTTFYATSVSATDGMPQSELTLMGAGT